MRYSVGSRVFDVLACKGFLYLILLLIVDEELVSGIWGKKDLLLCRCKVE